MCVCLRACMHVCLREHAQVRLDGDDFAENKFRNNSKHNLQLSNKWLAVVRDNISSSPLIMSYCTTHRCIDCNSQQSDCLRCKIELRPNRLCTTHR